MYLRYYVAESFKAAKQKMVDFSKKLSRPFSLRYNPYTESIERVDSLEELTALAVEAKATMASLCDALAKKRGSGVGVDD